ncbi:MAG: hypothetical protein NT180_07285 [Actinobacteria bacterium]|nr:hypothetical protein [Actinomycetota bacterium]
MMTRMNSTFFGSGVSRVVAICGAAALAMVAISSVSPAHASDRSVKSEKAEYIQPKSYDVDHSHKRYTAAAQLMDGAAVVYHPTYTAGLKMTSQVKVVSEDLQVIKGKIAGGKTYVGASYGTEDRGYTIHEKLVGTYWPSDEEEIFFCAGIEMCNPWMLDLIQIGWPEMESWGKVGKVKLTVGAPGEKSTVTAQVYAQCGVMSSTSQAQEAEELRCKKSDVVNGGLISYTVKKSGSGRNNRAATGTHVVIDSRGINYNELTKIAEGVQPAAKPEADANRDSLQLLVPILNRSICKKAIEVGTLERARYIAAANGYSVRPRSFDGEPVMGTADWRMDRINVDIVDDRIVGCSYG